MPHDRRASILLLSTSDTDLLAARASRAGYRLANPARLPLEDLPALLDGADLVVVRLLGGEQAWREGLDRLRRQPRPLVVLGGEQAPDAALMALSSVPPASPPRPTGTWPTAARPTWPSWPTSWPTRSCSPATASPPRATPAGCASGRRPAGRPSPSSTTGPTSWPATPSSSTSSARPSRPAGPRPAGLVRQPRAADPGLLEQLRRADALVVTVLAAGGTAPALSQAGGDDEAWDAGAVAALDVPVVQALCLTSPRAQWAATGGGLSPLDAATQVAIPEFDGRLISVPFSFKELDGDGLSRYVPDPERAGRVAGTAVALARLRHIPPADRRVAVVLSSYPTKHARIGNAVGSTPRPAPSASSGAARARLRPRPRHRRRRAPRRRAGRQRRPDPHPDRAGGQDPEWLTDRQLAGAAVRIPAADYLRWYGRLPAELRDAIEATWGPPRASCTSTAAVTPGASWCWPPCAPATWCCWCSRRGASGRTRWPSTTTRRCRPATTTWPPTAGWRRASAPTPSSISASTGRWSGCPARTSACRRPAGPTPPSGTCR